MSRYRGGFTLPGEAGYEELTLKMAEKCRKGTAYSSCTAEGTSFVRVSLKSGTTNVYEYSICLAAGSNEKRINLGAEKDLLDSNNTTMIQ